MRRVQFSDCEPSEKEYFEEYSKYNTANLWFMLIFILRSLVSMCWAMQIGAFENPDSVNVYIKEFSIQRNSCKNEQFVLRNIRSKEFNNESIVHCSQEDVVFRMNVFKGIGYCLGAIIGGALSDILGRRKVCFYSTIVWNLSAWVLVGIQNMHVLEGIYILAVTSCSIVNVVTFVLFGEMCDQKNRLLTVFTIPTYVLGDYFISLISQTILIWKNLQIMIALTNSLVIFACWYIPESPRWLLNKDKKAEAYNQISEISRRIYDFHPQADEELITPRCMVVFCKMLQFLYKEKLKNFGIVCLSMCAAALHYNCSKLKMILHHVNNQEFRLLVNYAEAMGFLFLITLYTFLGKRFGLFLVFAAMSCGNLVALLSYEQSEELFYAIFGILLGTTAICLNLLCTLNTFPTFLRGTVLGSVFFVYGATTVGSTFILKLTKDVAEFEYYVALLILALLGSSVLALPDTSNKELPNFKLY